MYKKQLTALLMILVTALMAGCSDETKTKKVEMQKGIQVMKEGRDLREKLKQAAVAGELQNEQAVKLKINSYKNLPQLLRDNQELSTLGSQNAKARVAWAEVSRQHGKKYSDMVVELQRTLREVDNTNKDSLKKAAEKIYDFDTFVMDMHIALVEEMYERM